MKLKYLLTIIILLSLLSCYRTYDSKFVISEVKFDYFPTFIHYKTVCDSIILDLNGSELSQYTLVVLTMQKEFIEDPEDPSDVPFEGMYGRLDSIEKINISESVFFRYNPWY